MTFKQRVIVLCIAGLVIAGVVAVYYMPQWKQTQAASKGRPARRPARDRSSSGAGHCRAFRGRAGLPRRVGTARALNTVTVRSQVNISFVEGQDVPQGLAKIDPTSFLAQYYQAVASKAKDEAQLANARVDFERYTRLAASNAVNRSASALMRTRVSSRRRGLSIRRWPSCTFPIRYTPNMPATRAPIASQSARSRY